MTQILPHTFPTLFRKQMLRMLISMSSVSEVINQTTHRLPRKERVGFGGKQVFGGES